MERVADMTARSALAASVGLQAVITAFLGWTLNEADSLLILVFAASACMLCGALTARGDNGGRAWRGPTIAPLISLNVWTAVSFISFFLGVAIHSAAVVFTLEASFAPLGLIVWTALRAQRGDIQPRPGLAQCWAAFLLAVLGALLVAVIAQSDSGRMTALFVASVLGVLAGVAAGRVARISRDLSRHRVGVAQVMTHRFYVTAIVAAGALFALVPNGFLRPPALHVGVIGLGALASVVVPIYLLQYSMQRLEPLAVTAALATMPAIAIAVELVSGQSVSWIILLLGALLVPANLALMLTRANGRKPPGPRDLQPEMEYQ
jgi:drug/metabolite transporter (DMT)-like permease